ncbi:TrmH family RNA methyltransferase [Pseudomonadota bacterium]
MTKDKQLDHTQHQSNAKKYPVCLLAHDIVVPTNVGSLFRVADALGLEKIYLTGQSAVPPNRQIKKTSRSTEKFVSYSYTEDPLVVVDQLRSLGYTIISLEITSSSADIRALTMSAEDKVCLVLGSESTGVCQALLDVSDQSVHIPMYGQNSSMNVAMACSIATFEIIRELAPL